MSICQTIDKLYKHAVQYVFKFLPCNDVVSFMRTCKHISDAAADDSVWRGRHVRMVCLHSVVANWNLWRSRAVESVEIVHSEYNKHGCYTDIKCANSSSYNFEFQPIYLEIISAKFGRVAKVELTGFTSSPVMYEHLKKFLTHMPRVTCLGIHCLFDVSTCIEDTHALVDIVNSPANFINDFSLSSLVDLALPRFHYMTHLAYAIAGMLSSSSKLRNLRVEPGLIYICQTSDEWYANVFSKNKSLLNVDIGQSVSYDRTKLLTALFLHQSIRHISVSDADTSFYTNEAVQRSTVGHYFGVNCTSSLYFLSPETFKASSLTSLDITFGRRDPSGILDVLQEIVCMPQLQKLRVKCPAAGVNHFQEVCLAKVIAFLAECGHMKTSQRKHRSELHHRTRLDNAVPWERVQQLLL
jgi:hypothetical protein